MTCIVGLIDGRRVWMGGDSAGVSGLDITVRADAKVFRNGDFLIGFTSSFRMGQLLAFHMGLFHMAKTATVLMGMLVLVGVVDALSHGLRRWLTR